MINNYNEVHQLRSSLKIATSYIKNKNNIMFYRYINHNNKMNEKIYSSELNFKLIKYYAQSLSFTQAQTI